MRIKTIEQNIVLKQLNIKINDFSAASNPTTNIFLDMFTVKRSLNVTSNVHGYDINHKISCIVV